MIEIYQYIFQPLVQTTTKMAIDKRFTTLDKSVFFKVSKLKDFVKTQIDSFNKMRIILLFLKIKCKNTSPP